MALTPPQLEALAQWCTQCDELADARSVAWRTFFDEDDPRPTHYPPGVGDSATKGRRFLGWFMFDYELENARRPVDLAVPRVLTRRRDVEEAGAAIAGVRHILGIVETVLRDRVVLELEDERFEVRQRQWTRFLRRDDTIVAHVLPIRRGEWLAGPGWVHLALGIGPGLRADLRNFQPGAIEVERLLQGREGQGRRAEHPVPAREALEAAVGRMTALARRLDQPALAMSPDEWSGLVGAHLDRGAFTAFVQVVLDRIAPTDDLDRLNEALAIASDIWNATPQPDRDGLTATEQVRLASVASLHPRG